MNKKTKGALAVAAGCLLLVAVAVVIHHRHAQRTGTQDLARPVQAQPVVRADVAVYLDAVGTVTPVRTAVVRAQVSGVVTALHFQEGQPVHAGQVLATLDDRELKAQVLSARGALERDQAVLANARADLDRYRRLLGIGSATAQQVDTQAALVRQYAGTLTADRGQLQSLQVQLGYTQVASPIEGVAGLRQVDVGNLVQPGDGQGIVTVTTVAPVTVKFAVPQDALAQVAGALSGGPVQVLALDRTGQARLGSGLLEALDNRIDTSTGTVMARARFDDAGRVLFPNQFVNVRVRLQTLHGALLVPTRAIQHGADGDYVYVVRGGVAVRRPVASGPVQDDSTVVLPVRGKAGVAAGDAVVVEGADALDDGMAVQVVAGRDAAAPAP